MIRDMPTLVRYVEQLEQRVKTLEDARAEDQKVINRWDKALHAMQERLRKLKEKSRLRGEPIEPMVKPRSRPPLMKAAGIGRDPE